ncbi:alpha/beta-hydrolase [Mycena filopes]|nr:alpha/beta-hydrolase [Mycena filopes]
MSSIRRVAFGAFLILQNILPALSTASAANVVDTGYAKYRGNQTFPNTVAYLGIPYAEPPLGDLRFRAPLPLNTNRVSKAAGGKIVDASEYPNFCIQGSIGAGDAGGAGSEDCLKVNIYAPSGAKKGSNLPVLVYIHGGGYYFGNPRNWPFDHWIHQSPNVVIVSVYYRLDSFGFLSTPEFSDPKNGDHNAGFSDQVEALKWVNRHISSFGGDPKAVTINGQSAGGSSVELHLVANTAPLFRGAIAQSVYRTPLAKPEQRVPQFQVYASKAGCGSGSTAAQLACLRSASVSALAVAQDFVQFQANLTTYKLFQPVVDGKIFSDFPTRLLAQGKFADVAIVAGSTTNETLAGGPTIQAALQSYFPSMSNETAAAFLAEYPLSEFGGDAALQTQVATGEPSVQCGRHIMATAGAKRSGRAWAYRYNQPDPNSGSPIVGHSAENAMMFRGSETGFNGSTTFTTLSPANEAFAAELIAYWLSFVRAQNPNKFKLPTAPVWAPYTVAGRERIVLQQPAVNATGSGSFVEGEPAEENKRCTFVAGQVAVTQD